jgi:hypothetical protein
VPPQRSSTMFGSPTAPPAAVAQNHLPNRSAEFLVEGLKGRGRHAVLDQAGS